jgi:uridine phosphorylase
MQPDSFTGQLAVITAAIRDEGTTSHYLPMEFPAVADPAVTFAIADAARELGHPYRLGVSQSKDSFYGEVEPGRMPLAGRLQDRGDAVVAGGALSSEMEAAAIFVISSINRVRAGGVMRMWLDGTEDTDPDMAKLLGTAVQALRNLIRDDKAGRQWP